MKRIANFLFEANALKRIKRTGWEVLGVKDESVAEHMWVTAVIGYVLAKLAKTDEKKVVLMCLFHNFYEARLGDLHSMAQHYLDKHEGRRKIEKDVFINLPFGREVLNLIKEYREGKRLEAKLAKDADELAFMLQLKEFIELGVADKEAREWFAIHKKSKLKTSVAKNLLKEIEKGKMHDWWRKIKEEIRKKWERGTG